MNMKTTFDKCLKNNKIKKFEDAVKLVLKELESAENDLKDAKDSLKDHKYKWATIQSYYSMFHTARAFLYSKGYREKSHICLISAIYEFFVKDGIIPKRIADDLLLAKEMRENADYGNDFSKESAETLISSAEEFLTISKQYLK